MEMQSRTWRLVSHTAGTAGGAGVGEPEAASVVEALELLAAEGSVVVAVDVIIP